MERPRYTGTILFLLLTLWSSCYTSEVDLTVEVSAGKQECFWQTLPAETAVEVDYQVIDGGDMDVDVVISGPDFRIFHSDQRKSENVARMKTTIAGDYRICFDNTFSRFSSKIVYFEIFVEDGKDDDDEDNSLLTFEGEHIQGMLDITVEDFLGILDRSKRNLERTIQVQTLIRIHEAKDRNTQESNFHRVNFFSFLQLSVMISVALVQVFLIRSLFMQKPTTGGSSLKART